MKAIDFTPEWIEQMDAWNVPQSEYVTMTELADTYGIEFISQYWTAHHKNAKEAIVNLKKELEEAFIFSSNSWRDVYSILSEALDFYKIESAGIWDNEELAETLERKRFLCFYEDNKKIICSKGIKTNKYLLDTIKKALISLAATP